MLRASRASRCIRPLTSIAVLICLCIPAAAHDGYKFIDLAPPHAGPGYSGNQVGLPGTGFASSDVHLIAWLTLFELGALNTGATVEGYVDSRGVEYAVFGGGLGTSFVSLADLSAPQVVGVIPGVSGLNRDVRVYGDYAYLTSDNGGGIQIVSLHNLGTTGPKLVNTVLGPGTANCHTTYIDGDSGFLYRCNTSGADPVRVYDLNADPENPPMVAAFGPYGGVHECQVVTYQFGPYKGKQIAFLCAMSPLSKFLSIWDVTDKSAIVKIVDVSYPQASLPHQSWITPDYNFVYLNDEWDNLPQTRVFHVGNLSMAHYVGSFYTGAGSVDHNLYIHDDRIYESNYKSGLRVFRWTDDPLNPTPVGWFDTYPLDDGGNYNGLWDNYPFLPSGIVLGADISRGLFVWWPGAPLLSFSYLDGPPEQLSTRAPTPLIVQIDSRDGFQLDSASVRLHIDSGAGYSAVSMNDVGGGRFEASLPAAPCGERVNYFVSARLTNGMSWRDPPAATALFYQAHSAETVFTLHVDTCEVPDGWIVGPPGDTATGGFWEHVAPLGNGSQVGADHTEEGTHCWVTGQHFEGQTAADNDVDGGFTSLISPPLALAGVRNPLLGCWIAHRALADVMYVQLSPNGVTWTTAEVIGPTDAYNNGWRYWEIPVARFIEPSNQTRVRFVVHDDGPDNVVDAAVDDLSILSAACPETCSGDFDGDGFVGQPDLALLVSAFGRGAAGDIDGNGTTDQADLAYLLSVYGAPCP